MDTFNQNKTLKLVQKPNVIPTQICVPVDCSRINRSIYYRPPHQTYRNGWKIRLSATFYKSYDCKTLTSSQNFLRITPVHASWYLCSTDPIHVTIASRKTEQSVCEIFNPCHRQIILLFSSSTFIHKNQRQSSLFTSMYG